MTKIYNTENAYIFYGEQTDERNALINNTILYYNFKIIEKILPSNKTLFIHFNKIDNMETYRDVNHYAIKNYNISREDDKNDHHMYLMTANEMYHNIVMIIVNWDTNDDVNYDKLQNVILSYPSYTIINIISTNNLDVIPDGENLYFTKEANKTFHPNVISIPPFAIISNLLKIINQKMQLNIVQYKNIADISSDDIIWNCEMRNCDLLYNVWLYNNLELLDNYIKLMEDTQYIAKDIIDDYLFEFFEFISIRCESNSYLEDKKFILCKYIKSLPKKYSIPLLKIINKETEYVYKNMLELSILIDNELMQIRKHTIKYIKNKICSTFNNTNE
jgi:hypothetical protein